LSRAFALPAWLAKANPATIQGQMTNSNVGLALANQKNDINRNAAAAAMKKFS